MATARNRPAMMMDLDVSFASTLHRPVERVSPRTAAALRQKWDRQQQSPASSVGFGLRLSFAATQIEKWLWIGSYDDAKNTACLAQHNITHVLNVAQECESPASTPIKHGAGINIQYMQFHLKDHQEESITPYFVPAISFIEEARRQGGAVLLHCKQGVSRSASFAVAYLMVRHNLTFEAAYAFLHERRERVNPNMGFVLSLVEFQKVSEVIHYALESAPAGSTQGTMKDVLLHVQTVVGDTSQGGTACSNGCAWQSSLFPKDFPMEEPHHLVI